MYKTMVQHTTVLKKQQQQQQPTMYTSNNTEHSHVSVCQKLFRMLDSVSQPNKIQSNPIKTNGFGDTFE